MCDTFVQLKRWQQYLEVSGKCNAKTRQQYKTSIIRFLGDVMKSLGEVTEDDVIEVLGDYTPKYRAQSLRALRSLYSWGDERDQWERNPVKRMHIPKGKARTKPPTLTDDEQRRLLDAADRIDPRCRWAIQLALSTGGRAGSLVNVTRKDISNGWIHFRVAKYDKPYSVPLGPKGQEAVEQLVGLLGYIPKTHKHRKEVVVDGVKMRTLIGVGESTLHDWVKDAGELAGLRAYPHLMRYCYGTRLANDPEMDMRTWATAMNHRDGSLFDTYAASRDERLTRLAAV
jgi:integrase